jgi:hypothetical protein
MAVVVLPGTALCPPSRRSRSRVGPRAYAWFPLQGPWRWWYPTSAWDRKRISGRNPRVLADTIGLMTRPRCPGVGGLPAPGVLRRVQPCQGEATVPRAHPARTHRR